MPLDANVNLSVSAMQTSPLDFTNVSAPRVGWRCRI
jgi:hypothetical protein